MEQFKDGQESISSTTDKTKNEMEKPQIHTTESGTQYVRAVDVVRSKAGWAEIQRLKEADLVRPSSSTNNANNTTQSHENR